MKKFLTIAYWSIFSIYLVLLIDTVFIARDARRSINLVPFQMISEHGFSLNVWGNIIMFIPLGLYVAVQIINFTVKKSLAIIISASVTIEIMQFTFARGATDIDDLLLNTGGGFIGICMYVAIKKIMYTKENVQHAIARLSLLVGVPIILLVLVLFFVN